MEEHSPKKLVWRIVESSAWFESRACRYSEYVNVGDHRLRLTIGTFIGESKNYAKVAVWGQAKWNLLYEIPPQLMATLVNPDSEITVLTRNHFIDDLNTLTNFAYKFFGCTHYRAN